MRGANLTTTWIPVVVIIGHPSGFDSRRALIRSYIRHIVYLDTRSNGTTIITNHVTAYCVLAIGSEALVLAIGFVGRAGDRLSAVLAIGDLPWAPKLLLLLLVMALPSLRIKSLLTVCWDWL